MKDAIDILEIEIDSMKSAKDESLDSDERRIYKERIKSCKKAIKFLKKLK